MDKAKPSGPSENAEVVVNRLLNLARKLERGEWRFIDDQLTVVPGEPEVYKIRYETS